jgi:hypothetical protein
MDTTPRADVRQQPGVERVVAQDKIRLVIDGRSVAADVRGTWLPPPPRTVWLLISSVLACALLAGFVLVRRMRPLQYPTAVVAGVGVVLASGTSAVRVAAGAVIIALAIAAWVLRNRWGTLIAGGLAAFLAVTHFEVFEHRLLAGWAPTLFQRVGIAAALACGAAVVGAELVVGLSASAPTQPTPLDSPVDA